MKVTPLPLLVLLLATSVAAGKDDGNIYRPLSTAEFDQFEKAYYQLSDCQKAYAERTKLSPDEAAARIIASGSADQLVQDALRVLPPGDSAVAILKLSDLPQPVKIQTAMVGLAGYAIKPELLPVQSMRAFGVVRKYFAKATESSCQPDEEFNKTLKVMLDANF
jgi:hypothetical protein